MPFPAKAPGTDDFKFSLGEPVFQTDEATGLRKFSGVAYTGDVINRHPYWGSVIFDLSMMKLPPKLAALRDHEGEEIVGYANESSVTEAGLAVGGVLSSATEAGREVAALSDEGFPWQMSVRIDPERIEEVLSGSTTQVNGRQVTGPAYIFRESSIIEVSFTATGWDRGTSATALSRNQEEETMSKELEDKVTQLTADLQASMSREAALTDELNSFKNAQAQRDADLRMSRVTEAYKAAGKELSEDDAKKFAALPEDAVNVIINTLKELKPTLPPSLFSMQAENGKEPPATNLKPQESALLASCDAAAQAFSASSKR